MRRLLWLDDIRNPFENKEWLSFSPIGTFVEVFWVKNYSDFVDWISCYGLPDAICFDHDLGEDVARNKVKQGMSKRQARKEKKESRSGYDAAKWLVEYCELTNETLPLWGIQSANPIGKENIDALLSNYLKFKSKK